MQFLNLGKQGTSGDFLSSVLMSKSAMPTGLGVTQGSDRPAGALGTCLRSGSINPWLGAQAPLHRGSDFTSRGNGSHRTALLGELSLPDRVQTHVPSKWSVGT